MSTINGKDFTCPKCGGHEIHEIVVGWCRSVSEVKSLSGCDGSWED